MDTCDCGKPSVKECKNCESPVCEEHLYGSDFCGRPCWITHDYYPELKAINDTLYVARLDLIKVAKTLLPKLDSYKGNPHDTAKHRAYLTATIRSKTMSLSHVRGFVADAHNYLVEEAWKYPGS